MASFVLTASQEVCLNNTCRNQGTCSSPDGFTVICACKIGYAGKFCEIYTSPCRNPPCLNGGHCIDENQSFGCVCADGYQGMMVHTSALANLYELNTTWPKLIHMLFSPAMV